MKSKNLQMLGVLHFESVSKKPCFSLSPSHTTILFFMIQMDANDYWIDENHITREQQEWKNKSDIRPKPSLLILFMEKWAFK